MIHLIYLKKTSRQDKIGMLESTETRIRMVSGDTMRTPDEGYTSGSWSMEDGGLALRFACAEARAILIEKASARLGVPAENLKVADGAVSIMDGKKLTYGQIAESGIYRRRATANVAPKPASEHKIVGMPIARLDIPAKIMGSPVFVQDLRMPGMVFGRIIRPPGPRTGLQMVDMSAVERMPGVLTVVRQLEATFTKRYVAHGSIGPSCAVAEMKDGRLHVWSHTQGVYPLRKDLAAVMRLAPESVVATHVEGAGCYGHNGADDAALDAALLARAVPGRPVKVQWMRDDEFAWEPLATCSPSNPSWTSWPRLPGPIRWRCDSGT